MNRAVPITTDALYQLSCLLYQAALVQSDQPAPSALLQQIRETIGLALEADLDAALGRLAAFSSQGRDEILDSFESSAKAQQEFCRAVTAYLNRQTARLRFEQAVANRTAQSMYNFAYGLSHEINNPLANISARAQQLAKSSETPQNRKSLENIIQQTRRAHEMLSEMMLAVQLPSIRLNSIDLRPWAEELAQELAAQAEFAHLQFDSQVGHNRLLVNADLVSLGEAITALLDNAMTASPPGGLISFVCRRTDPSDSAAQVRIAITDNGCGLSDAAIAQAFDLYYCGRESGRSLGIGLCKAKRIIESHGGEIWLNSQFGVGTAVEIRLPLTASPPR